MSELPGQGAGGDADTLCIPPDSLMRILIALPSRPTRASHFCGFAFVTSFRLLTLRLRGQTQWFLQNGPGGGTSANFLEQPSTDPVLAAKSRQLFFICKDKIILAIPTNILLAGVGRSSPVQSRIMSDFPRSR